MIFISELESYAATLDLNIFIISLKIKTEITMFIYFLNDFHLKLKFLYS